MQFMREALTRIGRKTPAKKAPAEILTYRFDSEMVYVAPTRDFEEALNYAQSAFPRLSNVPRSRIALSVNVRVNGILQSVRIAPMAWPRVIRSLATYEIVDISVLPLYLPPGANVHCTKRKTEPTTSTSASSSQNSLFAVTTSDDSDEPPKYGSTTVTSQAL